MAMVQDELGNYYDDGTDDNSYGGENVFDPTYGGQFSMGSGENVFDPTYGGQYGAGANENVFDPNYNNQFGNVAGENVFDPTYNGQYGAGANESVFDPTYGGRLSNLPGGINASSIFKGGANSVPTNTGGNGITDFLKSLNLTNAGGIAGALAGATGAFTNKPKKAYEGSIPQLQAFRNMVTAPPTANYRPGQGGVNYNSDVFYAPRGTVPEGMMGTATPAAAIAAANAAKANAAAAKKDSTLKNLAKTAGLAALAKQVLGNPGNKTTDGLKTLLDKVTGGTTGKTVLDKVLGGGTTTNTGGTTGGKTVLDKVLGGVGGKTVLDKVLGGGKTTTAGGTTAGGTRGTPAGGAGGKSGTPAGGAGGTRGIGGAGGTDTGGEGEDGLKTPEGDYAGEDEFAGIDEQIAANENDLAEAPVLTDEEVDEELARVNAETDEEYGLDGNDTGFDFDGDGYYDYTQDMSDTDYGGFDYDGFDFGSNDLDLSEFDLGDGDYSDFDFGGGDDFEFDLGDFARGGRVNMAKGRYLQGNTDGMADKIPAKIGKKQPAALSHGEFVVPADVVSHLGNGNSDAGAKKLYQMMDRIRVARTGNKEQGRQINPDKFMPGGLTNAYANGGKVQGFAGPDGSAVGATGLGSAVSAGITGTETGPNSFAGDYISNMLGKTQALTESPYQQYMGPLSAGASGLQNQVFGGLQNTAFPSNLGQSFSSAGAYPAPTLGASGTTPTAPTTPAQPTGIASQYMNPYLQGVLDPQMAELRRQNDITNMGTNAKLTQAGGFGGGRQAIMNSENNRNLMQEMNKTVGQGYANAYDKAQQQFNTEQTQGRSLADLMAQQGATQRGIEAEGMAADKALFEGARENPYKMLQFQQSMLNGLPVSATSYNIAQPTKLQEIMAGAAGGAKAVGKSDKTLADLLTQLGL